MTLTIQKIKRTWFIMAGVSKLAKFKTREAAEQDLADNPGFYQYWAGSASVSVENTEPVIIRV